MARIGILTVTDEVGEALMRACLPPEHRVVGEKKHPSAGCTEYLIEGPTLPDRERPDQVMILISHHRRGGIETIVGAWRHAPNETWQIEARALADE